FLSLLFLLLFLFFVSLDYSRLVPSFPTRRSSDLGGGVLCGAAGAVPADRLRLVRTVLDLHPGLRVPAAADPRLAGRRHHALPGADRKSTRLNSSHVKISYAVFCWKKKKYITTNSS